MKSLILALGFVSFSAFANEFNCKISISSNKEFIEGTSTPKFFTFEGPVNMVVPEEWSDFGSLLQPLIQTDHFKVVAYQEASSRGVFPRSPRIAVHIYPEYSDSIFVDLVNEGRNNSTIHFDLPDTRIKGSLTVDCTVHGYRGTQEDAPLELAEVPANGEMSCHTKIWSNSILSSSHTEGAFNGVLKIHPETHEASIIKLKDQELYMYTKNTKALMKLMVRNRLYVSYVHELEGETSFNIVLSLRGRGYYDVHSACLKAF